jgi:hypothetical protein
LQIATESWIALSIKPYLHAAIHGLFTIFRNPFITFLKISKRQLHKQLPINKQQTKQKSNNKTSQKINNKY